MKKVTKFIVVSIVITSLLLASCQPKTDKAPETKQEKDAATIEMPAKLNMTEDEIALRDQEKAKEKVLKAKEKMASEALEAVLETQKAIQFLSNKKNNDAVKSLQNALGKIDIATKRFPELKLLPTDINVQRNELITDINTVKQVTKDAEKALKNDQLQEARELLSGLSSEIDITTVSIPLATYPTAIKSATQLINENKVEEARVLLIASLDELVIEKEMIPIPVLNAEVMIEEATRLHLEDSKANNDEVINLLDNASYQLQLAEVLGYGNKDKVYKELQQDIKTLQKEATAKSDLKDLLEKLKIKLKNFNERVF
jgi:hypothetical protein